MTWGHKITIIYLLFVALIATMITICIKQEDIHLVSKEYYREEIAYQEQIEKLTNARALGKPVSFQYDVAAAAVTLALPESHVSATGHILFFRPADARQDVSIPLQPGANGYQRISVADLATGLWKVKINWTAQGKAYLSEQVLFIQ